MIGFSGNSTEQFVAEKGLSFESHFRRGAECIIARPDAPTICFPDSMPLEFVRDTMDRWNVTLQEHYPGKGYYAFSQADEMANPGYHCLALFSDQSFCDAFIGSVESETMPPDIGGMMKRQFRN